MAKNNNSKKKNSNKAKGLTSVKAAGLRHAAGNYNTEDLVGYDPSETPGWELMKSPSRVKGTDQMRLVGAVREFGLLDAADNDLMSLPINELADFVDFIGEKFSVDPAAFEEFSMGNDGIQRAVDLAVAFSLAVGKARNSA